MERDKWGVVCVSSGELYSISNIHTLGQASLAVMLVVELLKQLPVLSAMPTRALAVVVGELYFLLTTSPFPMSREGWVLLVLNGLLAASSAIGGWHLLYGVTGANGKGR